MIKDLYLHEKVPDALDVDPFQGPAEKMRKSALNGICLSPNIEHNVRNSDDNYDLLKKIELIIREPVRGEEVTVMLSRENWEVWRRRQPGGSIAKFEVFSFELQISSVVQTFKFLACTKSLLA